MKAKQKKVIDNTKEYRKPAFQDDIINAEFVLMQRIVALENEIKALKESIGKNGEVHNHYHYHYPKQDAITYPSYPTYPGYTPYNPTWTGPFCGSGNVTTSNNNSEVKFTGKYPSADVEGT